MKANLELFRARLKKQEESGTPIPSAITKLRDKIEKLEQAIRERESESPPRGSESAARRDEVLRKWLLGRLEGQAFLHRPNTGQENAKESEGK